MRTSSPEANGGKAVSRGLQHRTEEGAVVELGATILIKANLGLEGGTADEFGKRRAKEVSEPKRSRPASAPPIR
jgi:hypothetical protein